MPKENKQPGPGRAAWSPTDDQRALVRQMAAAGDVHEAIAAALDISVPTLRKHCADELRDRMGADNLFAAAGDQAPAGAPRAPTLKRPGAGGRKRYQPLARDRERVAALVAAGMPVGDIARALDITAPTLRRHFRDELATGGARKRAEVIDALFRAALKGSVAAQKLAIEMMDRADLGELSRNLGQGAAASAAPEAERAEPLGKKAQADQDARGVIEKSRWAGLLAGGTPLPN